jgi:hypothetical protein
LFSILLASALACAQDSAVNAVIAGYAEPGETFTKSYDIIGGEGYYFVSFNGGPVSLVFANVSGYPLVVGYEEIRAVLLQNLSEDNVSLEQQFFTPEDKDAIWAGVVAFNASRDEERECFTLIGMDRFPCTDLDTCWRACYTPACQTMKLGSGAVFLGYAQGMYVNGSDIDANISEFRGTLFALSSDDPALEAEMGGLFSGIGAMRKSAGNIESNPIQLREAVGFCYPMDYDYTGLINASALVASHIGALQPVFRLNDNASAIAARTQERLEIRERNLGQAECRAAYGSATVVFDDSMQEAQRALSLVSYPELYRDANALAGLYSGLNCSRVQSRAEVEEFNASFSSLSSDVRAEAGTAVAQYSSASDLLSVAENLVAQVLEVSPGNPEAQSISARLQVLQVRLDNPDMAELPAIAAMIEGNKTDADALVLSVGNSQAQASGPDLLLLAAAACAVAVAAAAAYFAAKRRR